MVNIKIGTCGYGFYQLPKNWKETYKNKLQAFSNDFKTLELNRTFYKLPMVKTVTRWQKEVAKDFEFTLKSWQAITHPITSPTWKNKEKLSSSQREQFGYFNPSEEVFDAWDEVRKRAEALHANIVVFQTPNSFNHSKEHKENLYEFFTHIKRKSINLAWEPRGNWNDRPSELAEICEDLNLIHVVDIMRRKPVSTHSTCYIRLHGLNKKEYDYNYDYSKQELNKLAEKLRDLSQTYDAIYCMFNNYEMYSNAKQLRKILA